MKQKSIFGNIVTHEKEFKGTVVFDSETGLILSVENAKRTDALEYSDSCFIFPGFGDVHIHAREDESRKHVYKEDFSTASAAALNGGVVHIADMPNNPVPPVDSHSYSVKRKLADSAPIHITLYAGIGPETSPLSERVPYKAFMGPSIGELYFETNADLEKAIERYRGCDVSFHCEDPEILRNSKSAEKHEDRRPKQAEVLATDFALYLIEKYGLNGKLCHYSTKDGLQKIISARKRGVRVLCEVTPTHLFFDREILNEENSFWFQMNPPLRDREDRLELIEAVRRGDIDLLATDHAPHTVEEKKQGISGISQLDTYSLFVTHLILNENIPKTRVAEIAGKNPGDFVRPYLPSRFGKGFGYIEPGYSASFTILNLTEGTVFKKENIKSRSGWSPFENHRFPGSVQAVYYHGTEIE
ncbi:MAG TPA: amidohydrolase family protein [Leptospiraceae bacterium]|nr:amidohydrolase family protein [Leptospiraceae bacterium]